MRYFEHEVPIDPSGTSRRRSRAGKATAHIVRIEGHLSIGGDHLGGTTCTVITVSRGGALGAILDTLRTIEGIVYYGNA